MIEYICTQGFQKLVLCLKVSVKCASADIRFVYNVLNGHRSIGFSFKQGRECREYRISCLSLPSIHDVLLSVQFLVFVQYRTNLENRLLKIQTKYDSIDTEQDVCYQIHHIITQAVCQGGDTMSADHTHESLSFPEAEYL